METDDATNGSLSFRDQSVTLPMPSPLAESEVARLAEIEPDGA
jgi:hypothetical protein